MRRLFKREASGLLACDPATTQTLDATDMAPGEWTYLSISINDSHVLGHCLVTGQAR